MAITPRPKKNGAPAEPVDVDALIAKGGSSPRARAGQAPEKEATAFTLRVPKAVLTALDDHLKGQPYKMPRHQWILEAIVQRLERETLAPPPRDSQAP